MTLEEVKQKTAPILKQHGVAYAAVFGSVARGEAGAESDVDLLVRIGNLHLGIWGFIALQQDLERALQKKVDLISEGAMNPKLEERSQKT